MLTRTQNGASSPRSLHTPPDAASQQPEDPDPAQVLSLDQICVVRVANEYTEGPGRKSSEICQEKTELESGQTDDQERNRPAPQPAQPPRASLTHPPPIPSAGFWTGVANERLSTSLEQRLLLETSPLDQGDGERAEIVELKSEAPKKGGTKAADGHANRCACCGRCKCDACTRVRTPPSCWLCSRRCLCSAENLVEYGTCLCCIKGLFYHCSNDDEDVCADDPCSCSSSHRCLRWATMGLVSFFLPCLLCYIPLKGCLRMFQACYDRAKRPGCKCRDGKAVRSKSAWELA